MKVLGVVLIVAGLGWALVAPIPSLAHRGLQVGTPNPDTLIGHRHGDDLKGLGGNDYLYGRQGPDFLLGGRGDDWLYGGKGSDYLSGQGGYDTLLGGRGNDFLQDLAGINVFKCGPGYDVVRTNSESLGNIDQDCEEIFSADGERRIR